MTSFLPSSDEGNLRCFLRWILPWNTAPSTAPCLLGFGSGTFSPLHSLTKPSLPSPPFFFATQWSRLCVSHSLSTLQSGFCSDHASLETPCKEIVNGLLRTKRLLWRPGGCGPPTVNPILCVPGGVLLPPISLGVTFSSDILCLTPNSCVSQGFSFFLFFQFPFSSLDSLQVSLSGPQNQLSLYVWLPPTPSTQAESCFRTQACRTSAKEITLTCYLIMQASVLPHESILSWKHFLILAISSVILTTSISVQNCPPPWCDL